MKTSNLRVTSLLMLLSTLFSLQVNAQVGIGTITPNASSMLDIDVSTLDANAKKGILIPRMTTTEREAIASPASSLLVFDTTSNSFWFNNGDATTPVWKELVSGSSIADSNENTKIEVEQSPDQDKIHFSTANVAKDASIERMTIDNTGVTKIGDIAGGNDTKVEADGTLVFEGGAEVWDDLRVSMDKGSSSASLEYFSGGSGGQIWYFRNDKGLETLSFQVQLPHSYKEGTRIYPHLHWTPRATKVGNIEWNLDYTWVNYDSDTPLAFPAKVTSTVVAAGGFTENTHMITALTAGNGGLDGDGKKISSILICRLWRNSGDSQDTYEDDAGLLSLDFHYQIDTVGSREPFAK
ncbi:hypothetical protein [Yeosuana marina]|uniref:hypothetical protein n=1 Tax=Yeosuana marina TaxID=1565536 RepID=UPI0030C7EED7